MIVLRSPKGWTGPKEIDGHKVEGYWRSHQVPFSDVRDNPRNLKLLESWLRSYEPEKLFDADGRLRAGAARRSRRSGAARMSANPHANGGLLRKDLKLPDFRDYAVAVREAGKVLHENTKPLGEFLRDVMRNNMTTFRVFGPDETASNRLQAIYEVSKKTWMADMLPEDADGGELARDGRVMEMLSEHTLLGWLEGYLLTGRHGFFHTYEAFAHVIDSMFNQHAKWLDICKNHVPLARVGRVGEHPAVVDGLAAGPQRLLAPGSGLHRSRHQQESGVGHAHLPAARRQHAARRSPTNACARTDCINVIVADKQKHLQFTTIDEAIVHCAKGIGIWRRGQHRRRRGAGRRAGVVRRRRDAGGAGRRRDPARARCRI